MSDTLLLVEDDPGSQELIRALCAARGYGVDVAGDGFLGLRLLSERRHAIVLIDYHLPEMDGYALARLMREIVGPGGRVTLVGITADGHGLASRRGADALFDAILVKPLDPDRLYATLDRLTAHREPAGEIAAAAEPVSDAGRAADALWRRRGLPGRPRAVLCPDLGPEAAAAVGQAFDLCGVEAADLILVGAEAGLDGLAAMREAGPGRHLPTVDLTGRLGRACDLAFRVDDAEAWTRLAQLCRAVSARRAALSPPVRDASDAATRLLAGLYVGDRTLSLAACADPAAAVAGTGLSRAALMSAILSLTEAGLAVCVPAPEGVVVRLTDAGHAAATGGPDAGPAGGTALRIADPGPPGAGSASASGAVARMPSPAPAVFEVRDALAQPVFEAGRIETLRRLVGEAEVARLVAGFRGRIEAAFPMDASRAVLAREAHALVAMAGSLGFTRLSAACRALEAALSQGTDATAELRHARGTVRDSLAAIPAAR